MLEIIVIIAVVKAFGKLAEEKGLNKTLWSFIGAASYYGPILLMSFVILPALIMNGTFSVNDETTAILLSVVINLATGIICCLVAYQILKNQKNNTNEVNDDILDHGI